MSRARVISAQSSEVRAAFEQWLASERRIGAKLVVLEGLTLSGKTTLTKQPFLLGGEHSTNVGMDSFLPKRVADTTAYLEAIDHTAMLERIEQALREPPLIVLEGAIVWPAVQ